MLLLLLSSDLYDLYQAVVLNCLALEPQDAQQ